MENVCHTLTGLALARAGAGRRTTLATTALVVGANLPDVDLVWSSFRSSLVYFHYHRGITHSIAGAAGLGLLLWLALLAFDRLRAARRAGERARPGPLLVASLVGVGSHVLMDFANTYGVRPFLPWSDRWVYGDLLVVVDPWLWIFLGGAVYLSGRGTWRRDLIWLLASACAAVVVLATPIVSPDARMAWGAALALLLTIALRARARRNSGSAQSGGVAQNGSAERSGPPGPAQLGVALALAYAALAVTAHHAALDRVARLAAREGPRSTPEVAALPRPADPLHWEGVVVDEARFRYGTLSAFGRADWSPESLATIERGLEKPAWTQFRATCAGEVIAGFFRYPFARVEDAPEGGKALVVRDARYTRKGGGFAVHTVPLDADGRPRVDEEDCP